MPLREDLLRPIPGTNPSGKSLRTSPDFQKIKEARREEDLAARVRTVIKLAGDALATKTKDLQLAAWLTEACVWQEQFPGLKEGLDLILGLVENFWDTVYPEAEDGDLELRSAPIRWVAEHRDVHLAIRSIALTKSGYDWLKYDESRAVPYEAAALESAKKLQAREDAIAEGKLIPEEFDKDVLATPVKFYEALIKDADEALRSIAHLQTVCGKRLGAANANFGILKGVVEEVRNTADTLLNKKQEADKPVAPVPNLAVDSVDNTGGESWITEAPASTDSGDPTSREDALNRIVASARYLRSEDPYSPVPYMLLRALRWGELRAHRDDLSPDLLEAPPTETRHELKRLSGEGSWTQVLEAAENAMSMNCGRGWLDLQRYVVRACAELGSDYDGIALAVRSELGALLEDLPELAWSTLTDDTPTANAETQTLLEELRQSSPAARPRVEAGVLVSNNGSEPAIPDRPDEVYETAQKSARSGRLEEALELLGRAIAQEHTGRGRFQARIKLAQICIASKKEAIAYPLLQELAEEIQQRNLEEWESADVLTEPLVMLYRCIERLKLDQNEKQKIYRRICRIDPVQASRLV
jgi:type VI secretion system protein ImpA